MRRALRAGVGLIVVVVLSVVLWVAAYVGAYSLLMDPIRSTALGCSLHKRFHSFNGSPVKSETLGLATDCLKVTMFEREEIIRISDKIAAVRAWSTPIPTSPGLRTLSAPDEGKPLIVVRACNQPPGTSDFYVYLDEDWIGFFPSKRHQRPICRGEWREMAAIITRW